MTIILGIDPGSQITGYGLIQSHNDQHHYIDSGCIRVRSTHFSQRLQQIFAGISTLIHQHQPQQIAIEQVFVNPRNPSSALKLGQARGAAIVAATNHTLSITEYSARQIKQSVVGYGAASKEQVQQMIRRLLNITTTPTADAADALAVALCHAHSQRSLDRLAKAQDRQPRKKQ